MKRVCVITGSRADYGLLRWVIEGLHKSDACELQIIATGMQLSPEFGSTWQVIESDGYQIDWKVEMLLSSDTATAITKSMGLALMGFADAYAQLKPDLIVVLGDRFEILSAASAAMIARIPIAHLHGGEITEGAFDDPIRHAITKMAHLHFAAAEPYRQRIIQMGEQPACVWNVGGFGIDSIVRLDRMDRAELEASLGFSLGGRNLMVTFHPETATGESARTQMSELLAALEDTDAHLIFTMPNADTEGRILFSMIEDFVATHPERACAHVSLGQRRYLSALAQVDGVVGNSSSGIIEAPAFGKGTVNIGARQDGRLRAASVIDCRANRKAIYNAISRLYSPDFQSVIKGAVNPYGDGGASARTVQVIEDWAPSPGPKGFVDLPSSGAEL
ncbi:MULTISPECIES: UDP-N-acetylglucosamine 2-epimerase [Kordiimonas]|jgi:GDP/UDP-N,N'-diacetylbacillosamine 2-epimerase (hydrolysing)|uniref:UDP-N-acetylglucosamine 2-epimerase n=1 Tax=Kordiimonas TaxID=288021 RepID=UPI00257CE474|nr:UDP-N-acetylglucosamine 2-epimerase [Kordiimonas sp. UBA4487]